MGQARERVVVQPSGVSNAFGDPVAPGTDIFGDPVVDALAVPSPGAPREVYALVWPRSAADNSSREVVTHIANTVTVGLSALLPAGDPITPTDRVFARGAWYEVEGEAADYKAQGVIVALKRTSG